MSSEPLELDLDDDGSVEETDTRWEGYADYRKTSLRVAAAIENAVDAYARIDSAHQENASIQPEYAAEARARIQGAAIKLIPELQDDKDTVDTYDEILNRWQTPEDPDDEDDHGFMRRLNEINLSEESPGWLFQLVLDIRTAGWELGYLKAGRVRDADGGDPVEEESDAMVND